jgi:lipase ATG15
MFSEMSSWFTTSSVLFTLALPSFVTASDFQSHQQQPIFLPPQAPFAPTVPKTELQLRHIFHHGTRLHPGLHRKTDVSADAIVLTQSDDFDVELLQTLSVKTQDIQITRLADRTPERMEAIRDAHAEGRPLDLPVSAWANDKIRGPNVTDKETVVAFAKMAMNAYVMEPWKGEWEDVGGGFNFTEDFGWQEDGLRGHIFADTKNKTVVIGLKGTSPAIFDGQETTTQDKVNDNLFFSCCCGAGGSSRWLQVCDCKTATYTCNSTCLVKNLRNKDRYYDAAKDLYHNVTALYPNADILLAGHSLGGAVASLLGLTYGIPVLTFGAPGDAMPAARLGLPTPPGYHIGSSTNRTFTGGYHFGHTADSIYTGRCNGWTSTCSIAGYAMESECHTGYECSYDTIKDKGWHNNMLNHRMTVTLHQVIEAYEKVAECKPIVDCWDCFDWKYFESNSSKTTTSSSASTTSFTQTRTETCKTPGWWGCRDPPSATGLPSVTTSIPTMPTTTCETPGWFGCKDPSTTTATTESTTTISATSSCTFPGWFGCRDSEITSGKPSSSVAATPAPPFTTIRPTAPVTTTTCKHKGLFGDCKDERTREPDDSPWIAPTQTVFGA